MKLEALPGDTNTGHARMPSDKKMEQAEGAQSFAELKKQMMKYAYEHVFLKDTEFMQALRDNQEFQLYKRTPNFDDKGPFETLAAKIDDVLVDRFDLEDRREQAALLALLAHLDVLQDEQMRKDEALKRAA